MPNVNTADTTRGFTPDTVRLSELSVEHHDLIETLRRLPTQRDVNKSSDVVCPLANANFEVVMIDPKNPAIPLKFSQTFIEPDKPDKSELETIVGTPLREVSDLIIIRDDSGNIVEQIYPVLLEQVADKDGNLVWIPLDGNHRLHDGLTNPEQKPFCVILVSNIPEEHAPAYWPVDISELIIAPMPLEVQNRRHLKDGVVLSKYKDLRPSFSRLGSADSRSSLEEMLSVVTSRPILDSEPPLKQDLMEKIRHGFVGYAPPPPDAITSPKATEGTPEIVEFSGVTSVSRTLGMANFRVDYGPQVNDFRLLIKTREEFESTAVRGTPILTERQAATFSSSSIPPAKEFTLSPEMQQFIASEVSQYDTGVTNLDLVSSSNPDAPRVIGFSVDVQNSRYYSTFILKLSDNTDVAIVLNRPRVDTRGRLNFGTATVVRDTNGNYILGYRIREGIGALQLETSRRYDPDRRRLVHDFGEKIVEGFVPVSSLSVSGAGCIDSSPLTLDRFITTAPENVIYQVSPVISSYLGFAESTQPGRLSSADVHRFIVEGTITDSITVAALTADQLIRGEVVVNPEYAESYVLMEEVHDPLKGSRLITPRLPLKYYDRFSPVHPDLGKSLDVEYSARDISVGEYQEIAKTKRLVPVSVTRLTEMAKTGEIDYSSLGHLSTTLRRRGVWQFAGVH